MFRKLFSLGRGKSNRKRSQKARIHAKLGVESLERREVMAVTSSVAAGLLTVTSDAAADTIAITCVAGNVKINGADPGTGVATCASLSSISVDGGAGNDTINLSAVTYANFRNSVAVPPALPVILNPNPLQVTILGGTGNDSIVGSQFSDVINDGGDADTVIGGGSLDQRNQGAAGVACSDDTQNLDDSTIANSSSTQTLTREQVCLLLQRADRASASDRAIIVVVDRAGHVLGVNVEPNVIGAGADQIPVGDLDTLVFAIDGAVAEARTGAFFASRGTPLTSRTIRNLSQTTVLEREVNSNPNVATASVAVADASTVRGPGTVAPIGRAGHFPPEIQFTPQVDLFDIEHTNRDSIRNAGPDRIKGNGDDFFLRGRFDVDPAFVPTGQDLDAPESYGLQSGLRPAAQARGFGTLPGGIPILGDGGQVLGGIGVFFPGPSGFASFEQGFVAGAGQSPLTRYNAPLALEAEYIAFAALGGFKAPVGAAIDTIGSLASVGLRDLGPIARLPRARIELVSISLEIFGPNPGRLRTLDRFANQLFRASGVDTIIAATGSNQPVLPGGAIVAAGEVVPQGEIDPLCAPSPICNYLVTPHSSPLPGGPTVTEVEASIRQGVAEALRVRAAIRLPRNVNSVMVISVADNAGNVLGLFRMPDSTIFSIEVAASKARNTAYYASPDLVVPDQVDTLGAPLNAGDGVADVPVGTAFTNRTFRFLALPFFPEGQNGATPGDFSICNDLGRALTVLSGSPVSAEEACAGPNRVGGPENRGLPIPASFFNTLGGVPASVMGFHAFHPASNFRDPTDFNNQSGIVFFPGSSALYRNGVLIGGYGISGDGVDQDDVVTFAGVTGVGGCSRTVPGTFPLQAPGAIRADEFRVRGVRLPYIKFLRNPCSI